MQTGKEPADRRCPTVATRLGMHPVVSSWSSVPSMNVVPLRTLLFMCLRKRVHKFKHGWGTTLQLAAMGAAGRLQTGSLTKHHPGAETCCGSPGQDGVQPGVRSYTPRAGQPQAPRCSFLLMRLKELPEDLHGDPGSGRREFADEKAAVDVERRVGRQRAQGWKQHVAWQHRDVDKLPHRAADCSLHRREKGREPGRGGKGGQ